MEQKAKLIPFISLALLGVTHAQVQGDRLLTDDEALEIVQAEREGREAKYQARRAELEAIPALDERVVEVQDHKVIVRRVSALNAPTVNTAVELVAETQGADSIDLAEMVVDGPIPEMLSLSATVYGDQHSQITWSADNQSEPIVVWTNICLRYLSPLTSFESAGYRYDYFQFTEQIDHAMEQQRIAHAAEFGLELESRWQEPPVPLSDQYYEYVVITEGATAVPEKLYRQLDALFSYYLGHKDSLEIRHKNSETLQAARRKDAMENPKEPKDSVTNFWPGKNSVYLNKDEN